MPSLVGLGFPRFEGSVMIAAGKFDVLILRSMCISVSSNRPVNDSIAGKPHLFHQEKLIYTSEKQKQKNRVFFPASYASLQEGI